MTFPIWFLVSVVGILALNLAIDIVRLIGTRRHHDHLIAPSPRAPRR